MTTLARPVTEQDTQPRSSQGRTPLYVWLTLGFLVTNMFSGQWALLGIPAPLDRGLLLLALVLVLLDPFRPRLRWQPVHAVMVALVLWTTWSAIGAGTLLDEKGLYALLDRIVVPCLLFVVAPTIFATERSRVLLLRTLALMGIYLGAVSFFEMVGPQSLVLPRYITETAATDPMMIGDPRAHGPFLSGEANGFTMALCLCAAGLLWARSRGWWRLVTVVAVPACLIGILLTVTRSVWLGAALGLVAVSLLVRPLRRWLIPAAVAVGVAIGGVLAASPELATVVGNRFAQSRSLYDRANTYEAGLRALAEQPLWGVGWSTFIDDGTQWVRQAEAYPITTVTIEIHNVFLSRAVETGYPGAALWLLVLLLGPGVVLVRGWRATGELRAWWLFTIFALCVWIVPSMTSPNPYPLPNNLVWIVAGIAGTTLLTRRSRWAETPETPGSTP